MRGNQDAFLTEMKPDGSALIYSTYIGGTGTDFGTALALDSSGDAFVIGIHPVHGLSHQESSSARQ